MADRKKEIRLINNADLPSSGGHYSQAVIHGDTIYISGQLPRNSFTGEISRGDIVEQTLQVLENIGEILKSAGSDPKRVIKTTVYITDIELWPGVNEAYKKFFGSHKPARAVVPTPELHYGALVEIDAIAAL